MPSPVCSTQPPHSPPFHTTCSISLPSPPQENYFLDDGAYGALKIVIEMVRRRLEGQGDIADLLKELRCALHTLVLVILMICGWRGKSALLKHLRRVQCLQMLRWHVSRYG